MNFLILSKIGTLFDDVPCSVRTRDRARIFGLIAERKASSRVEVANTLSLRSTSVSEIVSELIEADLLRETAHGKSDKTKGTRGRPVIGLSVKFHCLGVIVLQVSSQLMIATLLDLGGQIVESASVEVSRTCDNKKMAEILNSLCSNLILLMPPEMRLAGIVASLPGVLDIPSQRWMFASRWPGMHALNLVDAIGFKNIPIHIVRNLDAELRGRVARSQQPEISTLLFHWGFGIGSSYAVDGAPMNHALGRFGEVGHWKLHPLTDRLCVCEQKGCLETAAALWSMIDELRRTWPELPSNEASFAEKAASIDLLSHPRVVTGMEMVVFTLHNLCRVLFPQRIIITGPFVANTALWKRFFHTFQKEPIMKGMMMPELVAESHSHTLESEGAALPLFLQSITDILVNPNTP